jgi:cytochrome c peroxidase
MKPLSFLLLSVIAAAQPAPIFPLRPFSYANPPLPLPITSQAANLDSTPPDNPTTDAGATLGRVLFHEKRLSRNNTLACASCHIQEIGFSDPRIKSPGFDGGFTARHSMGIADSRWNAGRRFFWDERAPSLEAQALEPIQDPIEMGLTLPEMVQRLQALPYYASLFSSAFGDSAITPDRVARAIAQFERSILSYRSRYDQGRALVASPVEPFPNFTAEENLGKDIFFRPPSPVGPGFPGAGGPGGPGGQGGGCAACHQGELMTNNRGPQNNGLDAVSSDLGAFAVTGLERHRGAFRAPSLRNIAARAPYMHDGRFRTLDEVVAFYNNGVQPHPQLDPLLLSPSGVPRHLGLNPTMRQALVRFLETLTDRELLADPRFSDPFRAVLTVPAPSFSGDLAAPDSLVSAFSNNLPLPEEGLQVFVRDADGAEHPAAVSFGSRSQVNFHIPPQVAPGWASVRIQGAGTPNFRGVLEIVDSLPGLFSANGDGRGAPAGFLVERKPGGELTRTPLFTLRDGSFAPASLRLDPAADAVLELYGSGFRNAAASLSATIAGQPAELLYAGPQGAFPGLDQLNLKLPAAGLRGDVPIRIATPARESNSLTLRFE